jgi:hypothetical protein
MQPVNLYMQVVAGPSSADERKVLKEESQPVAAE